MNSIKDFSTTTAILLFAQSEKIESGLKPIASCSKQNVVLWKKMNERVLTLVQKTKLPYFISDENTQKGASFGDKLSHAIQSVLDKGYEKVIVLGNDSPGLRLSHLQEAIVGLQNKDSILGPDFKGGTYLIGVSRATFDAEAFAKIDWQTAQVFEQLQGLYSIERLGIIAPLADCNSKIDFEKLLQDLPFYSSFKSVLASLIFYLFSTYLFLEQDYTCANIGFNFNKGSPVLG